MEMSLILCSRLIHDQPRPRLFSSLIKVNLVKSWKQLESNILIMIELNLGSGLTFRIGGSIKKNRVKVQIYTW